MRTIAFPDLGEELADIPIVVSPAAFGVALDVSEDTIGRYVKTLPGFPQPVRIGKLKAGFYKHEIVAFIKALPRAKDAPVHHEGKLHLKSPAGKKHWASKRQRAA